MLPPLIIAATIRMISIPTMYSTPTWTSWRECTRKPANMSLISIFSPLLALSATCSRPASSKGVSR